MHSSISLLLLNATGYIAQIKDCEEDGSYVIQYRSVYLPSLCAFQDTEVSKYPMQDLFHSEDPQICLNTKYVVFFSLSFTGK